MLDLRIFDSLRQPAPQQKTLAQAALQHLTAQQKLALIEAIAHAQLYSMSIRKALRECVTDYLFPTPSPADGFLDCTLDAAEATRALTHIADSLQRDASPTP